MPLEARLWTLSAAAASLVLVAAPQARAQARSYSFSFSQADVSSVAAEVLGRALKVPFTVDPTVTGKMTFQVERRLTPDQLLALFEDALGRSGASLVRAPGGALAIVPTAKARAAGPLRSGTTVGPGYQTVAEQLKFIAPTEAARALGAMGVGEIVVHTDDRSGIIVLGGTGTQIRSARETIALLDRNSLGENRSRTIALQNGSAVDIAADLDRLAQAAGLAGVHTLPLTQLNSIVVFAPSPQALDEMQTWALRLDRPASEEASTLWVYRPRNVSAEALAEALKGLSAAETRSMTAPGPSPGPKQEGSDLSATRRVEPVSQFSSSVDPSGLKVSVERSSNSLLIMAPESRWRALQPALRQLDRAPDQVLIEATVLEVTLNHDFRMGVDWSLVSSGGHLTGTLSGADNGAIAPSFPGLSLSYVKGGVTAVVAALASRTNVEIVSSPKLVALDNQTASLQVGDQVPVVVQRAQGTGAPGAPLVTTTEYRDTGVILKIKPRINGERNVLLDLSQEVSGVARTTTSGIDSPTIQQRKFESSLSLQEGQTLAIGGLISSSKDRSDSGVPWLKDVPVAGALFRTGGSGERRTELIVLLSAHIVRADADASATNEQLKGSMDELGRSGLLERR